MTSSVARGAIVALLAVSLGFLAWAADQVSFQSSASLIAGLAGNLPSQWLVVAFVCGAVVRGSIRAPVVGFVALAIAVFVYYGAIAVSDDRSGIPLERPVLVWSAVALVAGPMYGWAGRTWLEGANRLRPWAVALLAGAILGEALYLFDELDVFGGGSLRDAASIVAVVEVGVALVLPVVMLRRVRQRVIALAATLVCAVFAYVAIAVVISEVNRFLRSF